MNLCRSCGLDFASARAFDAHRTGKHAYTYTEGREFREPRTDGRRCLASDEMEAAGWERDRWGRWVHPQALRNRPRKRSYSPPGGSTQVARTENRSDAQHSDRQEIEAATA